MDALRDWLLGVTAAALAVALAQALAPEGPVKRIGKLAGALVLLLAVLRPLVRLDAEAMARAALAWEGPGVQAQVGAGEELMDELIAERAAAYIADKGEALGCRVTAQVTVSAGEDGWSVPWSAQIAGTWTERQRRALSRALAEDLEIPEERQTFREEAP